MERQRPVSFSRRTFLRRASVVGFTLGVGGLLYGNSEIMNASLSPEQATSLRDNDVYNPPILYPEEARIQKEKGEVISFASLILALFSLTAHVHLSPEQKKP